MLWEYLWGIGLPLAGTVVGAGVVYGLPVGKGGTGVWLCTLAGGAMLAASFWSLLAPGLELGFWRTAAGFAAGMLMPRLTDRFLAHWDKKLSPTGMLVLAVALHNVSEGLAVGAGLAGRAGGEITVADAAALPLGIALQNMPDGAVVVLPLAAGGMARTRAFGMGVLSGLVEPVAAVLMICFTPVIGPVLPVFLGFAAGAMVHVVLTELTPQMLGPEGKCRAPGAFILGFLLIAGINQLWV